MVKFKRNFILKNELMNILVKTSLVFIVKLNLGGGWRNIKPIVLEGRRVGLRDLGRGLKIVGANEWRGKISFMLSKRKCCRLSGNKR